MKKLALFIFIAISYVASSQVIYNTTRTVTSRNYTQDVHIKNGATVKFTGTFRFAKNVRVYVENTSHIILDNATFERLNSNDIWFGIEMQGYASRPCKGGSSSAIILNSTVKGALIGIVNTKLASLTLTSNQELGAAVHIESSTFDNAQNAILFNEIYYCGLSAKIINSTFITSSNQGPLIKSYSVDIRNNNKIIKGNVFTRTSLSAHPHLLELMNSVGEVTDNMFNVNSSVKAEFGIAVGDITNFFKEHKAYTLDVLTIKDNVFDNCLTPILKYDFSPNKFYYIESNDFYCTGCSSSVSAEINLYYSWNKGSFKFNNINNKVYTLITNPGELGIPFYGNIFNNSYVTANGKLSGVVSGILMGQQFTCNKFIGSTKDDIAINWAGSAVDQGYAFNNIFFSNSNEFANNSSTLKNFNSNKLLKYYFYNSPTCANLQYPCNVINTNRFNIATITEDQCLTESASYLTMAPPLDNSISGSYKTNLLESLTRYKQKISTMKSVHINPCYYENIKDNYNPILLQPVDYADNHLIMNYLDSKLSYYSSLSSTSELYDSKNMFLSTYMNMKRDLNSALEQDVYIRAGIDSTMSEDSIKRIFRNIPHISSEYKTAEVFLKMKKFDAAIGIYNNIGNLYTIDSLDSLNAAKSAQLTMLERNLYTSNRDYAQMTYSEINTLRSIADFQTTEAGRSACFILGRFFGECSPENAIYHAQIDAVSPEISISPNPSSGMTLIQISNTANSDNSYVLKVFNAQGHQIFEQPLMGIELENVDLDISGWQNGNYYVSLFVNDVLFTSKTLQKN
jgi:hypothetical protein